VKHMWEAEHAYYCSESNYYVGANHAPTKHYRSWSDFVGAEGDADMDCNLLFRWDWVAENRGDYSPTGDPNYRDGILLLYWMGQRKGLYRWTTIEVCQADEDNVRDYLAPHMDHLMALWAPMAVKP